MDKTFTEKKIRKEYSEASNIVRDRKLDYELIITEAVVLGRSESKIVTAERIFDAIEFWESYGESYGLGDDESYGVGKKLLENLLNSIVDVEPLVRPVVVEESEPIPDFFESKESEFIKAVYNIICSNKKRGWTPIDIAGILGREGYIDSNSDESTWGNIMEALGDLVESGKVTVIPPGEPWPKETRWRYLG